MDYQRIDVSQVGNVTVATIKDNKIVKNALIQQLGQELFHLVEAEGIKILIVSFSRVGFLSQGMLGKLITLDKKVKAQKGTLRLCSISPENSEVFAITRLDRYFDIKENEATALTSL